jgi:hypothetical protein
VRGCLDVWFLSVSILSVSLLQLPQPNKPNRPTQWQPRGGSKPWVMCQSTAALSLIMCPLDARLINHKSVLHILFIYFFLPFSGTRGWTQGFVYACWVGTLPCRMTATWVTPPAFSYFWDWVLLYALVSLDQILLFVFPCLVGMTGTWHHIQALVEMGLLNILPGWSWTVILLISIFQVGLQV